MSQVLTIRLSDETFAVLQQEAQTAGTSPADMAATTLEQHYGGSQKDGQPQTDVEKQAARERFESHFGAVNLGYATGTENDAIDADLARAYADNHEDG